MIPFVTKNPQRSTKNIIPHVIDLRVVQREKPRQTFQTPAQQRVHTESGSAQQEIKAAILQQPLKA